jgi:hypothetical protein
MTRLFQHPPPPTHTSMVRGVGGGGEKRKLHRDLGESLTTGVSALTRMKVRTPAAKATARRYTPTKALRVRNTWTTRASSFLMDRNICTRAHRPSTTVLGSVNGKRVLTSRYTCRSRGGVCVRGRKGWSGGGGKGVLTQGETCHAVLSMPTARRFHVVLRTTVALHMRQGICVVKPSKQRSIPHLPTPTQGSTVCPQAPQQPGGGEV